MDQLVHDFNTALDETAGSNSSSRSSASRRKVTPNLDSYLSRHHVISLMYLVTVLEAAVQEHE